MKGLVETVRVEVPDPPETSETLAGFTPTMTLEDEEVAVRLTLPDKPALFSITEAEPAEPAVTVRLVGLATIVKLPVTVTVTCDKRNIVPLVALTVIVYVPAFEVIAVFTVSVELAEPPGVKDTLDGLRVALRPEVAMALRETMPVKPVLLTKILAVADPPASKIPGEAAAAVMVKLAPTSMTTSVE